MITQLPGLYEAEILQVQEESKDYPHALYMLRVMLPQGQQCVVRNAIVAKGNYGGIYDYFQSFHRPTAERNLTYADDATQLQTVGERCLVAFISGDIRRPIIVSGMPHPLMPNDLPDKDKKEVQCTFQVAGMRIEVWPSGKCRLVHQGAPKVTQGSAVTGQDAQNVCTMVFEDDGSWNVTDSEKQKIAVNRTAKTIVIENDKDKITLDKTTNKLTATVEGEVEVTAKKQVKVATEDKAIVEAKADVEVKADGKIILDGSGGKLKLESNKVALGSDTAELLDLLSKLLDEMNQNASTFVTTAYGPGVLNPKLVAKVVETKTMIDQIKGTF